MDERLARPERAARWVFGGAAGYGLIVLSPTFLMADAIGRASVPISHLEYFYGFTGTAVAWQLVFALIASDVRRFRPIMLLAVVEKLAFSVPALSLAAQGRLPGMTLPFAVVDLCLAAVFAVCFWITRRRQAPGNRPAAGADMSASQPPAIQAADAPVRTTPSNYPEPFRSRMAGRTKAPLGDAFGLTHFGVNLTRLASGAMTALQHRHSRQDEMVYVLEGNPTLVTAAGETELSPGMVAGFPAGGTTHHLENRTGRACVLLEIGDRSEGDAVSYPADDLKAEPKAGGGWHFVHKDGSSYD